ncbi:MAG TPA: hypothetical protein VF712_13855 [Thermoleophilaceae bacterium]|jgi:hypothetical protein
MRQVNPRAGVKRADLASALDAGRRLLPTASGGFWTGFSGRYTKLNRCPSEGRKAFATRLAGIESRAECERLAPLLSALVNGEAGADEPMRLAGVPTHTTFGD